MKNLITLLFCLILLVQGVSAQIFKKTGGQSDGKDS